MALRIAQTWSRRLDGAITDSEVGAETDVVPAEWWQRAVAYTIDWVVVSLTGQVLQLLLGDGFGTALSLLFPFAYFAWCNGEAGQTLGKRLLALHVVDANSGARIGFGRALLRYLAFLGLFFACIVPGVLSVLRPLRDPGRQTFHDKAVRSLVVAVVASVD